MGKIISQSPRYQAMTYHHQIKPLALSVVDSKATAERAYREWTARALECLDRAARMLRGEFCMITLWTRGALVPREGALDLEVDQEYTEAELQWAANRVEDLICELRDYQEAMLCAAEAARMWQEFNLPSDPVGEGEMWRVGE